jgi:hypothetical protein
MYSGSLEESPDDLFTDFHRFAQINDIADNQWQRYLPTYLTGTAKELYRTLEQAVLADPVQLRAAFVQHFESPARRSAALTKFYGCSQMPYESVTSYYCRMKRLSRTALHDLDQATRNAQVLTRFRQGLLKTIKRCLMGHEFTTVEEIRLAAENVEVEMDMDQDDQSARRVEKKRNKNKQQGR